MKIKLAILLACFALAGCQTAAEGWHRTNTTRGQTAQDFKECTYQANLGTPGYSGGDPIATGLASGMRINDLRAQCLEIRGYRPRG